MPTIKDIARECGVSANTVSAVLNNKTGEVSEKTRARILETMRRLNYRPNAAARRMVGKRTNTIGIADRFVATSYTDPYKAQILEPIIRTAREMRWDVLYYSGHANEEQAGAFPAFLDGRCDGLLCFTGSIDQTEAEAILQTGLPVVFIGDAGRGHEGSVIDVDNVSGGALAAEHLIRLGHTRIAMMQGVEIAGNTERIEGWRRALEAHGLAADDSMLYPSIAWEGSGYAHGLAILSQPTSVRPTAVFCFNDVIALGLLRAAAECGVRIPEELSIVGFDDVAFASASIPPLTTVRQPLAWIGERAVRMLLAIIDDRLPRNYREVVPPELVLRGSTAPPRS